MAKLTRSQKRLLKTIDALENAEKLERYAAAAFRLPIFTGCRLGETQILEWKSVDFAHGCLVLKPRLPQKRPVRAGGILGLLLIHATSCR